MYITTGINEAPAFSATRVYPNPASEQLTIENGGAGTKLEVFDIVGKLMMRTTLTKSREQIDISSLSGGMYLLSFTAEDGQKGTKRFVKQ